MTRTEILEMVREAMTDMFDVAPEDVKLEASLREELDLDSIDAIDMAARMHEITGERIELESLKDLVTVRDVVDLLDKYVGAKS
jgi:acyl carrier protein